MNCSIHRLLSITLRFQCADQLKAALTLENLSIHRPQNGVENMLRTLFAFGLSLLLTHPLCANDPKGRTTRAAYIEQWKEVAIEQMRTHRIPASITLAQGILESGDGNSRLAREANNHFGIKCHDWQGKKVYHDDDARNECFRKYNSARESFHDHSVFLKRPRYTFLFELDIMDYQAWAKGLKQAGYATNPKYPELLIRIIEENNLTVYDAQAMGNMPRNKKGNQAASRTSNSKDEDIVIAIGKSSNIKVSDNNIKYILTEEAETPESIARKLNMGPWQIRKYNDFEKNEALPKGARVYLQPKRNKSSQNERHIVQDGERLQDISQKYGVKQNKLLKRSGFAADYELKSGDIIKLK